MPDTTKTLQRALMLLDMFNESHPRWRLPDLAAATGIHKATAHRLLSTLEEAQVLARRPGSNVYEIHPRVRTWARATSSGGDFEAVASPYLEKIWVQTQETVTLAVLAGSSRVTIRQKLGTYSVCRIVEQYVPLPLHSGAAGKAILSAFTDEELDAYVNEHPLTQFTSQSITDPDALRAELILVRSRGFALSVRERVPDGAGVAAPIVVPRLSLLAALTVSVPAYRYAEDIATAWGRQLMGFAHLIERELDDPDALTWTEDLVE